MATRAFESSLEVWCGRRVEIPTRAHKGSGFSYIPRSATWFVGSEGETQGPFIVNQGTTATVMGFVVEDDPGGGIDLPVPPIPTEGETFPSVRVDIMIDGGINNNNNNNDNPNGNDEKHIVAVGRVEIDVIPNSPFPVGFLPSSDAAMDLAEVLNDTFGDLGLAVTHDGERLTFTFGSGAAVHRGFVLLRVLTTGGT